MRVSHVFSVITGMFLSVAFTSADPIFLAVLTVFAGTAAVLAGKHEAQAK